jgi:hypothetical protein
VLVSSTLRPGLNFDITLVPHTELSTSLDVYLPMPQASPFPPPLAPSTNVNMATSERPRLSEFDEANTIVIYLDETLDPYPK